MAHTRRPPRVDRESVTEADIPYGRQSINEDDIEAVATSLTSGWLTTGPAVDEFERQLENLVGNPSVALSSGTAALHAAYAAARVGAGSRVISTPMTFIATASTALQRGARVDFVDVDDDTLNISPEAVEAAATTSVQAITAVDYAGQPADLDPILETAISVDATLIEDASHSLGATYKGRPVGSIAHLTTFSFHPVKLITTGEGGAVATGDKETEKAIRLFRSHGLIRDAADHRIEGQGSWHQEVHELGLNYRLADPLAALGTSQIKRIGEFLNRRSSLAARYDSNLKSLDGIRLPVTREFARSAWHLYPIRVEAGRRRQIFEYMRSKNIGVQVHYLPVHLHPALADLEYRRGMCPVAERAYEELISLPLFPDLTEEMQDRVMEELTTAMNQ